MLSSIPQPVLIATQNAGKVLEIRRLLELLPAEFVGLDQLPLVDAPEENGATFLENARAKARYYGLHFGEIAIADDSGLEVDALDGAPGVHSARYGGDGLTDADRTNLLLRKMSGVSIEQRSARFKCAVVVFDPADEARILHTEAAVEGSIICEPRGLNGFGYDPIFVPAGKERTTAEMTPNEKDELSHRGRAIRAIVPALRELLTIRKS